MKYKSILLCNILFAGFLSACSSDDDFPEIVEPTSEAIASAYLSANDRVRCDSIVPLEGCRDSLPPRTNALTRSSSNDYATLKEELNQLNEIPIYLKVKGNSTNKHYLSASAKGKELTVEEFNSNSLNQQFYIKILPAYTGIPYLIYSKKTETPIRLGAYTNAPDTKILYASQDATGSLFGASWDIKRGEYSDKSYIIENQDYPRQGSSGYWLDIYYSVITVSGSKISFEKYNNLPRQEFEIIPVEKFKVKDITFDVEASSILSKTPYMLLSDSYTNNGPISQEHDFEIIKSYKVTSTYNQETSYNLTISTEVKASVPFIASGKITTSASGGQKFTYGESEEEVETISKKFKVVVPAYYRAEMKLTLYKYEMDVDYTATCVGLTSGKEIKIEGTWNGVNYEETDAVLNLTPINGNQAQRRSLVITKEMLRSNQVIKVE